MWLLKSFVYFLAKLPVIVLGLVVVAAAIPFSRTVPGTLAPFIQYSGGWELVRLPAWARWWDNPFDGLLGDKRGWWSNECYQAGREPHNFLSMWLWAAVRNPANYFSRCVIGCDVSDCLIEKLAGDSVVSEKPGVFEWQFLKATDSKGREFHRFFLVAPWFFNQAKAVLIDIGWKVKLSHNGTPADAREQDRFKGTVFVISPWKSLD